MIGSDTELTSVYIRRAEGWQLLVSAFIGSYYGVACVASLTTWVDVIYIHSFAMH